MNRGSIDLTPYCQTLNEDFKTFAPAGGVAATAPDWYTSPPWPFGQQTWGAPFGGPQVFSVSYGNGLIIAASETGGAWTSGALCSVSDAAGTVGRSFGNGYFEAVLQLPDVAGVWPSFWLNTVAPAGWDQPTVEIDVFEYYGHDNSTFQSTVHVWRGTTQVSEISQTIQVPPGFLNSSAHAFGVEITANEIRFFLDRVCYWSVPRPASLVLPMALIVDLALGGGWPLPSISSAQMRLKSICCWETQLQK